MSDLKIFAEILVEKLSDEQVTDLLQAVSDRFEYGSCPLCGEDEVPIDSDGNEIEGQNVEHAEEWREVHDADCLVALIEERRVTGKDQQMAVEKKVIILKGPAASGKSTWAKQQVNANPEKYKIISWDNVHAIDALILSALQEGYYPIIDANLDPKHIDAITELVKGVATIEIKDFFFQRGRYEP